MTEMGGMTMMGCAPRIAAIPDPQLAYIITTDLKSIY
jgi:hypothetical protein